MNNTITIKEAFSAWEKYRLTSFRKLDHFDENKLRSLFEDRSNIGLTYIEHLILCPDCLQKLTTLTLHKKSTELWDTAWRKAAATGDVRWPQKLVSKNGTYTITIRESESQKNSGVIIVSISDKQKDTFEGKDITVVDGKGRMLLKGMVKKGEVFQRISNLDTIDLRLLVRTID